MAQGTRVSANLFHDNASEDLFVEVDHGPFVVDNNLFLSGTSLLDMSEGGTYAHNLFTGKIVTRPELSRSTPYHPAHSTIVAGLSDIQGGDDRFFNNIFVGNGAPDTQPPADESRETQWRSGFGLWIYGHRRFPLQTGGNVFCNGAAPYAQETDCVTQTNATAKPKLIQEGHSFLLELGLGPELNRASTKLVNTALLGNARVPGLPYENPDGSPLKLDTDYSGKKRSKTHPAPGPFETIQPASIKMW
jgi:hypothetical protein